MSSNKKINKKILNVSTIIAQENIPHLIFMLLDFIQKLVLLIKPDWFSSVSRVLLKQSNTYAKLQENRVDFFFF